MSCPGAGIGQHKPPESVPAVCAHDNAVHVHIRRGVQNIMCGIVVNRGCLDYAW